MQERPTAAGMTWAQKSRPYAVAVLLTIAVLLMRLGLAPWVEDRPVFIIFLIPIVLSAYLGGLWPGLFATVLVAVATDWFVLPPHGSLRIENPLYFAQWLFMVLEGALISVLFAELQRWRRGTRDEPAQRKHAATELKVRVGFAAALAFLGTIGIVSYLSVVRLDANSRLVAHSHEVMANIDALRATATESEAASRAFLISGNEQFAAEYTRATGRIDGLLQQLADAVRDDPVQTADVPALGDAIRARIARSDQNMHSSWAV